MRLTNMRSGTVCILLVLVLFAVICDTGFCGGWSEANKIGGSRSAVRNDGEIESLGRFAVQQHNADQNTLLEFVRVVKAKEQVVSGKLYDLILEASDGSEKKLYEAKVWVKPWMNFKQLQEFKTANDGPSFTSSNFGVKHGY